MQQCQYIHYQPDANSESLLNLDLLQKLDNKKCFIFRGQSGREYLKQQLINRGGIVDYIECYQRICPGNDIKPLIDQWQNKAFDYVIFTSFDGLKNLWQMLGQNHKLLQNYANYRHQPKNAKLCGATAN